MSKGSHRRKYDKEREAKYGDNKFWDKKEDKKRKGDG